MYCGCFDCPGCSQIHPSGSHSPTPPWLQLLFPSLGLLPDVLVLLLTLSFLLSVPQWLQGTLLGTGRRTLSSKSPTFHSPAIMLLQAHQMCVFFLTQPSHMPLPLLDVPFPQPPYIPAQLLYASGPSPVLQGPCGALSLYCRTNYFLMGLSSLITARRSLIVLRVAT